MFLNYINNFRGIAILLIVAGHCLDKLNTIFGWRSSSLFYFVASVAVSNGTVLFVFIAGFLFQHLSRKFAYRNYLLSKLRNVIVPYVVVSTPIIALHLLKLTDLQNPFADHPAAVQMVLFYLTGLHLLPMWFVPMIALFYLAAPLLLRIDRTPRLYLIVPVLLVVSSFVPRNEWNTLQSFVHFLPVYLIGMLCSRYREQVLALLARWRWPLGLLLAVLIVADIHLTYVHEPAVAYIGYLNLWSKLLLSLLLVYWLYRYDSAVGKRLEILAATSFGMYFVHQYAIELFGRFVPENVASNAEKLAIFVVFTLLVFGFSLLVLLGTRRIFPAHSRALVGY